jgi:multidrug resistance efflux pump
VAAQDVTVTRLVVKIVEVDRKVVWNVVTTWVVPGEVAGVVWLFTGAVVPGTEVAGLVFSVLEVAGVVPGAVCSVVLLVAGAVVPGAEVAGLVFSVLEVAG